MSEQESNPFKMVDFEGGRRQVARRGIEWTPRFSGPKVETCIGIADGEPNGFDPVLILEGTLWTPPLGTTVKLTEPNREAVVIQQRCEIVDGKILSTVIVADPETVEQVEGDGDSN